MKAKTLFIAIAALFFAATANAQDIQDTFYGMQFGSELTADDIQAGVGESGQFKYTMDRGLFTEALFFDTEFDGAVWKSVDFYTNKSSVFFRFRLSNNYVDRAEAVEYYNAVKAKLDEQYRLYYTKGADDNILNRYDGSNGVKLMLTFSLQTSFGGDSFYYVTLDYISWSLYQSLNAQ